MKIILKKKRLPQPISFQSGDKIVTYGQYGETYRFFIKENVDGVETVKFETVGGEKQDWIDLAGKLYFLYYYNVFSNRVMPTSSTEFVNQRNAAMRELVD